MGGGGVWDQKSVAKPSPLIPNRRRGRHRHRHQHRHRHHNRSVGWLAYKKKRNWGIFTFLLVHTSTQGRGRHTRARAHGHASGINGPSQSHDNKNVSRWYRCLCLRLPFCLSVRRWPRLWPGFGNKISKRSAGCRVQGPGWSRVARRDAVSEIETETETEAH